MTADRPVVVVLYRESLPPRLAEISDHAAVRLATVDDLADALDGADVLYQWHSFSTALRDNWPKASSLKWVHVSAAGVSQLLFDELVASDIVYTNTRGVISRAIAEFCLGFVLSFAKDSRGSLLLQQQQRWKHRVTQRIAGQTALVVGAGSIGRETARLLRAAGLQVSGAARSSRGGDADFDRIHSSSDLVDIIGEYDYVILAAPLTNDSRRMVDADVLAAMAPSAHLINVGRGELVDTDALVTALTDGAIAGAALDVTFPEPLPPGHPLWNMENVLITPHMSGDTHGYLSDLDALFIDNLQKYRTGQPLENVVDKSLGFVTG